MFHAFPNFPAYAAIGFPCVISNNDEHWVKSLQKGNDVHDETLGQDQQNRTFQEWQSFDCYIELYWAFGQSNNKDIEIFLMICVIYVAN